MSKVWTPVFLLVTTTVFSMYAPALDSPTTTDGAVEQVKEAAVLDFNFIENNLRDLQQRYADSIRASYLNSVMNLTDLINQTYEEDIPKDTAGYNMLCLEGIYDDVKERVKDLIGAVAVCANQSYSATKADRNIAQFQIIISSLEEFSRNLTNLINTCFVKYPKLSWDRLQCVFDQVNVVTNNFNPVFGQVKQFNVAMDGHLMLLGVETSRCYQQALRQLAEINRAVLRDMDYCKIQMS